MSFQDIKTGKLPVANKPPRQVAAASRRIFCELDADTFALVNWVRMKHQPADMDSWLRATLRAAALEQSLAQIAGGRPLKQDMAELITRVRERKD